jgi:hypothetical protein
MSNRSSLTYSDHSSPPRPPPKGQQNLHVEGARYTAKRQELLVTFEMGYWKRYRPVPKVPGESLQLDWRLAHPPVPGITHAADDRCIEIAKTIRVGEGCGAQVVLTTDGFIAKFTIRSIKVSTWLTTLAGRATSPTP